MKFKTRNTIFIKLIFALMLVTNSSMGQNNLQKLDKLYTNGTFTEKTADSIITKPEFIEIPNLLFNISRFFYKNKNLTLAIKYVKKEISFLEKKNIKDKHYHNCIYLLGKYYMLNNQLAMAIETFKQATTLNLYPRKIGQSFCQLANCYSIKGNLHESFNHYIKGIDILKRFGHPSSTISHCINLALTCSQLDEKKIVNTGLLYLKTADSIMKTNPNFNKTKFKNLNIAFAEMYTVKSNYNFKKAIFFLQKTLKRSTKEKDSLYIANSFLTIGSLYLKQKNDSCIFFLNKALNYIKKPITKTYQYVAGDIFKNKAEYYTYKNQHYKSLNNIQKALNCHLWLGLSKNNIPSYKKVIESDYKRTLITFLKIKILNLLVIISKDKHNNKTISDLSNTVEIADKLVTYILKESFETETKYLWRSDISSIYSSGAYAAFLNKKDSLMFYYMEKNKAFLLKKDIINNNQKINLPKRIIERDISLRKKVLELENNKVSVKNKDIKKDSLFNLKFSYQQFQDSIKEIYPQYFENEKRTEYISLKKLKKSLDNSTVTISYNNNNIPTNRKIIGLVVTNNNSISFEVPNVKETILYIKQFQELISKPLKNKKDLALFKKVSLNLYSNLFPSKELQRLIKNKKLIITTDDFLQNVPFEALNTTKNGLSFLIEKSNISYAYSMSFLEFNKKRKRKTEHNFTGLAPINFQNKKLTPLTHTKKELNTIENLIAKSNIYVDNDATKETFLNSTQNSKIIHLATHAQTNPKPVIFFNKDSLNLHELYTYKNNADLVVLSACETNLGEIKKGEGTLSLARGFFYSGANSVISSLWNVNDASTTFLMKNFYSNLTNNQTKVDALTNAKRKYLKEHSLSERSPYYWASFVLIGDTSKTFENDYSLYFFLAFVIFLITIFLFFKIKK